jgi:hypothetical protein
VQRLQECAAEWPCLKQGLLEGRAQAGVRPVQAAQEPGPGTCTAAVTGGGAGTSLVAALPQVCLLLRMWRLDGKEQGQAY